MQKCKKTLHFAERRGIISHKFKQQNEICILRNSTFHFACHTRKDACRRSGRGSMSDNPSRRAYRAGVSLYLLLYPCEAINTYSISVRSHCLSGGILLFQNIRSIRVSDQIINQIQAQIVESQLKEGQKLPNEQELAQQFGVSRASVREALSVLESKGVVERHKNGGTFLCKYCLEKILAAIDIPHELDSELFEDLYEAREILEIRVTELACERADELDFMKIEKTIDMMQASIEKGDSGIKPDILFHQCIAMATKNQVIAGIVRSLGTMLEDMRVKTLAYPGRLETCLEEHRAIYRAIRNHDQKQCSTLMKKHFGAVAEIRSELNKKGGFGNSDISG